jgi:single-strand DNA-binding protein
MNKVILSLRLTKDPTIKYNGEMCIARFTGAVDRRFKKDGQQSADFPSCVAFGKTAEFCEKWAKKGMKFNVVGRLTTGSYKDKDDRTVYTTEVTVEEIEFGESKNAQTETKPEQNDCQNVPDDLDSELPFN